MPREPGISENEAFAREIAAITEPYLWCSTFDRLNDPMEGFYRPSSRIRRATNYDERIERVFDQKMNVGIASFSDNRNNELMWAHYAGNYSGICVAYRTTHLIAGLQRTVSLARIGCDDRLPRVVTGAEADVRAILSQKKGTWSYEREWRILGPVGRLTISRPCVTHIYLGALISPTHRDRILAEFRGGAISISEMVVKGYSHVWNPIHVR
jgi:hypothetical protein